MNIKIILIALLISISLILFYTHHQILQAIGDYLVINDKIQPSDIIHVIAGEDHRTNYAITLYQKGYGKKLFFTGGFCQIHMVYHGIKAKQKAISRGIPPKAIVIDNSKVKSTYEEILRLKTYISQFNCFKTSVIVVTDPHHTRRTRWAYRNIFANGVRIRMAPVPLYLTPYKQAWWAHEKTRRFVKDEYLKILYYYARYKFSRGHLKKWLASLDNE